MTGDTRCFKYICDIYFCKKSTYVTLKDAELGESCEIIYILILSRSNSCAWWKGKEITQGRYPSRNKDFILSYGFALISFFVNCCIINISHDINIDD